jgi:hypothetical protein
MVLYELTKFNTLKLLKIQAKLCADDFHLQPMKPF